MPRLLHTPIGSVRTRSIGPQRRRRHRIVMEGIRAPPIIHQKMLEPSLPSDLRLWLSLSQSLSLGLGGEHMSVRGHELVALPLGCLDRRFDFDVSMGGARVCVVGEVFALEHDYDSAAGLLHPFLDLGAFVDGDAGGYEN